MGTYIHFTDEQKERANSVDLEEFLRRRGEKLLRAGRESRLARVHHITVRGNEWYDHIARQGGLLYVFEAPMDLLSFLTLYPDRWQEHSYVALCGTGGQAVCWMLEQHPSLQSVVLCLWITTSPGRRRPGASRKSYREQDTTAVSCSLCIRTGTTTWCMGRPWPPPPWPWGRVCRPQRRTARRGGGAPCRWTGPRFILARPEGHTGSRLKRREQTTKG